MTRTTAKKKTSKKKTSSKKRTTHNVTTKTNKEGNTPSTNIEVNDTAFAAAVKDLFSPQEREDIIKEHNLMLSCKQAHTDIITAAQALGLKDEFDGCAFAIAPDGRFFPIEMETFDEEYEAYEEDEDDDEEDEEYKPSTIIRDLKKHMKLEDLSQQEMAEKIGCSQATVSTWLRDESLPRQKYCGLIADIIYTDE